MKNDGVERRGDGYRITVAAGRDPVTGAYLRIREQFDGTLTDARRRRDEIRVDVSRGTAVHADRTNVADYLERWIAHREAIGKLRPKTAGTYRGYARREITPRIGSMRVRDVRPVHVQRVLDEAIGQGLSARSVVQVHRIMHAAFRSAVRLQVLASNPSDGVSPPKIEAPTLHVPSPQDVARLLDAVSPAYRVPLALAAGSGLRRGEVLALRWGAVELDERPRISVEGTLQRADGSLVVLPPKTERSRRSVPLSASVPLALRGVRTDQLERRMLAGPAWCAGDYVFDRGDGSPIEPDTFSKAVRAATRAIGLDGVRLHDLRHAFASMLVGNGTNVRTVADLLGHSTVGFTLQTYVHPDQNAAMVAIDQAERLIFSHLSPIGA
ncbi:MAG: tyrosine-type recombinase/integrase [Actinomycetota bacterium]